METVEMTLDDQRAIDEAHRRFAAYLITSSIQIVQNKRSAVSSAYDAECFLKSDVCVYFVRLLGVVGDSLSDEEITLRLIEVLRGRGGASDRLLDF